MSQRVVIVGAGGHAHVVADILQSMHAAGADARPIGFVDDDVALHGSLMLELPVLGDIGALQNIAHEAIVVAIGDNSTRRLITERLIAQGERLATAIHPSAVIATSAQVGEGTMVCAGAIVNPSTRVGRAVILNTGCTVDHHNQIADYVHIGPGGKLGGTVRVGAETLVGIGAVILPNLTIGARSTIAGGAVVIRDVGDNTIAVGVPARALARSARS